MKKNNGSNSVKTAIGGVIPPTEHFPVAMTGLGENMWKKELLDMKSEIWCVAFKLSFIKGYYVLNAIGNDGYILIGRFGLAKYDIWEDNLEDALKWLTDNGFKFHEDSVIKP